MKHSTLIARCSLRLPSRWLRGILVSLALSTGPVGATYALGPAAVIVPGQIALQEGKLAAKIVAAPLRQVMEEVSRLSGAQVRWLSTQVEERPVSVEFTALPLPEALGRILGETNFLLFYTTVGEGTKLTQIWISAKGIGEGQSGLISPPASQGEEIVERQAEPDTMPIATLLQAAVSTAEPAVRIDAIARLGGYAQVDPRVESVLSHLASNDSNPRVQAAASEVLAGIE
jgi:hypothetical protein